MFHHIDCSSLWTKIKTKTILNLHMMKQAQNPKTSILKFPYLPALLFTVKLQCNSQAF